MEGKKLALKNTVPFAKQRKGGDTVERKVAKDLRFLINFLIEPRLI
jgi:hypothetical protein